MENMNRISLIYSLILLAIGAYSQDIIGSFYVTVPGNILALGNLTTGTIVNYNLTWTASVEMRIVIAVDGVIELDKNSGLSVSNTFAVANSGFYTIRIINMQTTPTPYELTVVS